MSGPTREEVLEWARKAGMGGMLADVVATVDEVVGLAEMAYAAGQDAKRIELQTEMQRLTDFAQTAGKWRGIALARNGDGRTVQQVQEEARAAEREACAVVFDQMAEEAEADCEPSDVIEYYRQKAAAIRARGAA